MVAAFDGNVYGTHWYWQDGRGNTSHITGDNNYLLERYTYDLEGRVTYNSPQGWQSLSSNYDTRFLFAGSQYIPQANLYDMRNRYYSPELNRFLQTDPVGLQFAGAKLSADQKAFYWAGKVPEAFSLSEGNLYRYCHNDDVDNTDPMGLWVSMGRAEVFSGTAEYQKLMTVTGSWIPQWVTVATVPITFTTSGNFSNSNPGSHVVASGSLGSRNGQPLKGRTDADVSVKRQSRGLAANLNINYYVIATKYNDLERQHTFGDLGGGSKVKGLLEKGGYWDQMQRKWSGGISDFLRSGRWRLESDLRSELSSARSAQFAEWELTPGSGHDVRW
jgi:RHS repeat-associated protein